MPGSLDALFKPGSVAVIGATPRAGTIGNAVLQNLVKSGFTGTVYPINPKYRVIMCLKSYPSILDVEDPVDMAIIVVNKDRVLEVVDQCGKKGVKGLVIISAGFKEIGGEGLKREKKLKALLDRYGMRCIGPNCMGIINTDPDIKLNASFARLFPRPGNIAFMSQSGALGDTILDYASALNIGFSMFASVGNKTDVSGNDLLQYWQHDERTRVILLYLESFGNPRNFTKIARKLTKEKPVLAVKSGRTITGQRAARSHTGALAGLDLGVDALFEQCGVIRTDSIEDMLDCAIALSTQPIPEGSRVAIVTNSGGPGIMATDALENMGLVMANLSASTKRKLKKHLNEDASISNPIDLLAGATAQDYYHALLACLADPGVDIVLVIFMPPIMLDVMAVADAIVKARKKYPQKPLLSCVMSNPGEFDDAFLMLEKAKIPVYRFPESAVRAIWSLVKCSEWRKRPEGRLIDFDINRKALKKLRNGFKNRTYLNFREASKLFEIFGIPVVDFDYPEDLDSALRFAEEAGFPVVMKLDSEELHHKTELGGVISDIDTNDKLIAAYRKLSQLAKKHKAKVMIQKKLEGYETIIGSINDRTFGDILMFGLGGIFVEVAKDVSFKINPLTDIDAEEIIRNINGYTILKGFRGKPAADLELLKETILRFSFMLRELPEIESMDINPFILSYEGKASGVVDAVIKLKEEGGKQ